MSGGGGGGGDDDDDVVVVQSNVKLLDEGNITGYLQLFFAAVWSSMTCLCSWPP